MKIKKIFRIVIGTLIFLCLPSLVFFGFIYIRYNEDLPVGVVSNEADALAVKMLDALNYEAYKATDYIEFTFKNSHHYKWRKSKNTCVVYWKNYQVNLDLNMIHKSEVLEDNIKMDSENANKLIQKALKYFNNDTFWLVAPYKVFDNGTERKLVVLEENEKALMVTYNSGGSTPGDSYLWRFDATGKPKSFKMWTSIIPIDGVEASWTDWTTTESGAQLPSFHKLAVIGLEISDIKGTTSTSNSDL